MGLVFEPVGTDAQVAELACAADRIWHDYWPALIGEEQTDYMVEMMLSPAAIRRETAREGYRYWLVRASGRLAGFLGVRAERLEPGERGLSAAVDARWRRRLFVSKVYLDAWARGRHLGSRMLDFCEGLCLEEGLEAMYLQVNRDNELGVRCYAGRGFEVVEDLDTDIGGGHVMRDHIMAKEVARLR